MTFQVLRHRTALERRALSRPIQLAIEDGVLDKTHSVFDYGCGRGSDLRHLKAEGFTCGGWDPNYYPSGERAPADVVNLGYVVNVIEDADERAHTLRSAWGLTKKILIVSARLTIEAKRDLSLLPYHDGCLTRRSTFQKFYEQQELRGWLEDVTGSSPVPAGPGIFYLFRNAEEREAFLASRYRRAPALSFRRRQSDLLFEEHRETLEPLLNFLTDRGRLPDESELQAADEVKNTFGSLSRAFSVIKKATGQEQWERIKLERSQDLLVYLALARFSGRPRVTSLPTDVQLDVRAFFSTYTRACVLADELLFSAGNAEAVREACRRSPVGKLTPGSLYVHLSAVSHLAPILRVYEGCARAYIGSVEGANIIKLKHRWPQVSYLAYPDFERAPHPELFASLSVPLRPPSIKYIEYKNSENPPILHRKETFLPPQHPLAAKFSRLTKQEDKYGLYEDTRTIGTKNGWQAVLDSKGVAIVGHRVVKKAGPPSAVLSSD